MAKEVVSGHKQLKSKLKKLSVAGRRMVVQGMRVQAHLVLSLSNDKYIPRRDGVLRNSGTVRKHKDNLTEVSFQIAYGGAAKEYALAVHEHLSDHSPPSWKIAESQGSGVHFGVDLRDRPDVGPKYLQRALEEREAELLDALAKAFDFEDLV